MNAKRQIQALNRYDWGNKTPQQVAKYVGSKLNMLGYKVPSYMKQGKISQKQLDFHLDRIYNKLEKIVSKEEFNKLPKSEQNKIKNQNMLEKAVVNYNVKVVEIRDAISKSNYGDKIKEFLLGGNITTNTRDKSFMNEKFDLRYIDINKLNYKSIKKEIKRIRDLSKKLNLDVIEEKINNSEAEDNFINELLDSEICSYLSDWEKDVLKEKFKTLNSPQKWLLVKDRLSQLREKYEQKLSIEGDLFDFDHSARVFFSEISMGVENYGKY